MLKTHAGSSYIYIWSGSRTKLCLYCVCITFRAELTGKSTRTGSLNKHCLQCLFKRQEKHHYCHDFKAKFSLE